MKRVDILCGYYLNDEMEIKMNKIELIEEIRNEFKGVQLNGGIGLNSAKAWDDYEQFSIEDEYLIDEEDNWESISDKDLDNNIAAVSYFDSNGMLFHLPAYMICELNNKINNDLEFYFIQWDFEKLTEIFSSFNYHQMKVTAIFFEYILTKNFSVPDTEELSLLRSLNKILKIKLPLKDKNFTGKLKVLYKNEILQYEAEYVGGELNGMFTAYYNNGVKKSEEEYKNGIVHGVRKSWNIKGALSTEGEYKNGKHFGRILGWHDNGLKSFESDFSYGSLNRTIKTWYENGVQEIEMILDEKNKYRKITKWDEKGKIIKQQESKDGIFRSII